MNTGFEICLGEWVNHGMLTTRILGLEMCEALE